MQTVILPESIADIHQISRIHDVAFGDSRQGRVVARIRRSGAPCVSLVAVHVERIVGHVLISPLCTDPPISGFKGMLLAPLAVLPGYQGQGIGTTLVQQALVRIRGMAASFVVAPGDEGFWAPFGFRPISLVGLQPQWNKAFCSMCMAIVLDPAHKPPNSLKISCLPEFETARLSHLAA